MTCLLDLLKTMSELDTYEHIVGVSTPLGRQEQLLLDRAAHRDAGASTTKTLICLIVKTILSPTSSALI